MYSPVNYKIFDYRKGAIVYVSSIGGYQPFPLIGAYSVSKTALLGLTRAVALQCTNNNTLYDWINA